MSIPLKMDPQNKSLLKNGNTQKNNGHNIKTKVFITRNSVITDLLEIKSIQSIYNIALAALLALVINHVIYHIFYDKPFQFGYNSIIKSFKDIHIVFIKWTALFVFNIFYYYCFKIWSLLYIKNMKLLKHSRIFYTISIAGGLFYYIISLKLAASLCQNLSIIGAAIILLEQTRILMKSHAFIRTNFPTILNYNPELNKTANYQYFPSIKQYLYFFCAPTFIYQNTYPRTEKTRWLRVLGYAIEALVVLAYMGYIFEISYTPVCNKFSSMRYSMRDILWTLMGNAIPASTLMMLGFYFLLHVWLNMFSEILRFGDRLFYMDWWNAPSYRIYFRKWNLVVHDFLYTYIYKDMYEYVTPKNDFLAKLTVFLVSAIFHEYVILYATGMFYPVLLIVFFTSGILLVGLKTPSTSLFNILFVYSLSLGSSINLGAYVIELCARSNDCIAKSNHTFEWYEPRSFSSICMDF